MKNRETKLRKKGRAEYGKKKRKIYVGVEGCGRP